MVTLESWEEDSGDDAQPPPPPLPGRQNDVATHNQMPARHGPGGGDDDRGGVEMENLDARPEADISQSSVNGQRRCREARLVNSESPTLALRRTRVEQRLTPHAGCATIMVENTSAEFLWELTNHGP